MTVGDKMTPELSIVVLAYNEAENLSPVLSELTDWLDSHGPSYEILVVDDGSTDDTAAVARRALSAASTQAQGTSQAAGSSQRSPSHHVISHDRNRGMGAGLKSGARAASGRWLTFLPADGQIPPAAIGALLSGRGQDTDLVLSVYRHRDDGPTRKVLSWGVRALIAVVHGVRLQSEGPYLIRRSLFDPEQLTADSFFLNFELPIRALAAGVQWETVVVECRPRLAGHSKAASPTRALQVARELIGFRVRRMSDAIRRARG